MSSPVGWKWSFLLSGVLAAADTGTYFHVLTTTTSGASPYAIVAVSSTLSSYTTSSPSPSPSSIVLSTPSVATGTRSIIPITSYTFNPFPAPTQSPIPGLFPATDPTNPPSVDEDDGVVPNFAPAWAIAYQKAKARVSASSNHILVM